MNTNYWHKQSADTPLYPNVEWNKPEQRALAGRLGIIGGSAQSFRASADAFSTSLKSGAGEAKVLLPDALKKAVPLAATDVIFAPSTASGGLSNDAEADLRAFADWASGLLLIGDAGKNSQTASVYETIVRDTDKPVVITRDAVDLLQNSASLLLESSNVTLVVSFAQLQRLLRFVYYPKMITFSMQLAQLVDTLHAATITYNATIVVFHKNQLIAAKGGEVVTTPFANALNIWRGQTASVIASYTLWNTSNPLKGAAAAIFAQTHA